jgi:hypothetical protein
MQNVHPELSKTRLCAAIVLAWGYSDQSKIEEATTRLKKQLGSGWSATSGFQFMAGKSAKAALDTADKDEQVSLLIAHQLARLVCNEYGLGAVNKPDYIDRAELMAVVSSIH